MRSAEKWFAVATVALVNGSAKAEKACTAFALILHSFLRHCGK
jgi:hypothetical protein